MAESKKAQQLDPLAIDGNDVLAITLGGPGDNSDGSLESDAPKHSDGTLRGPGWKKIFDVLALGVDARVPRGILFVPGRTNSSSSVSARLASSTPTNSATR